MDERKILCAAAMLGRSNMGMGLPDAEDVKFMFESESPRWPRKLSDYVEAFCQQFMENDEHYQIFLEEAQSWEQQIRDGYVPREEIMEMMECEST